MSLLDQIHVEEPLAQLLADELACVTRVFEQQLVSEHDNINHLCSHLEQYRGKMLRPALVVLAGLAVSKDSLTHSHRVMAAVVEMIHMATLVHDDNKIHPVPGGRERPFLRVVESYQKKWTTCFFSETAFFSPKTVELFSKTVGPRRKKKSWIFLHALNSLLNALKMLDGPICKPPR